MIVHKSFRYRVYPTREQEARLARWEGALRFLWNIAHEQRVMGLDRPRGERRFHTAFDQINELTELRRELPWLADVPRNVCAQLLVELDKAWQSGFKKLAMPPRWKSKRRDVPAMIEARAASLKMSGANIRFPKLGTLRTVLHRPLEGKPKICTLKRDGDQWFASLVCEIDLQDPVARTAPVLAIDRGITNLLADSDGNLTPNPKHCDRALARLARAQRNVSRKKKGSKNREKSKLRVMRVHRKVRRQREHFLHCLSSTIAKSNGVVVIENLHVSNMVRNRPLSRSIASAGWSMFANMLRYKLAWSGGTLVEVRAQYSSQTCSDCGVVDAASRRGERFDCTACGHADHADLNAAKVLKTRASRSGLPMEGSLLEGSRRSGKAKAKLRVPRHKASQNSDPHRSG